VTLTGTSHLMFFVPLMDPAAWGTGCRGPRNLGVEDAPDRMTYFGFQLPSGQMVRLRLGRSLTATSGSHAKLRAKSDRHACSYGLPNFPVGYKEEIASP